MTISRIRDHMNLVESYSDPSPTEYGMQSTFRLSVYCTSRPGLYGYQFAAILWDFDDPNGPHISSLTTGCGYDKIAHCVQEVIAKYADASGVELPYDWEPTRLAGFGSILKALALAFEVPKTSIYFVGP